MPTFGALVSGGVDSMLSGRSWQDVDVVGFLDSHDEADRESRYRSIRENHRRDNAAAETAFDEFDAGVDSGLFEEATVANTAPLPDDCGRAKESSAKLGRQVNPPKKLIPLPKRRRERKLMAGGLSAGMFGSSDSLKMVVAAVLAAMVLGFCGHKVYEFYAGPTIRVLQGID